MIVMLYQQNRQVLRRYPFEPSLRQPPPLAYISPKVAGHIILITSFIVITSLNSIAFCQSYWDPPAINVFPSHEKTARSPELLPGMIADGRKLFITKFNMVDGAGRPSSTGDSVPTLRRKRPGLGMNRVAGPDANSCFGCHNQPFAGGAGEFVANVFVGANLTDPPTQSIEEMVTNERNTIGMFGSYAIELLAREMTRDLRSQRASAVERARGEGRKVRVKLRTKGVDFGSITAWPDGQVDTSDVEGVDPDLVIKPFSSKGVIVSLREFTVNALNQHHGIQAVERFGKARTGRTDFDQDGIAREFTVGQVSALVLFQASLPAPGRLMPEDRGLSEAVGRGERLFVKIGCAVCHIPEMRLDSTAFIEPNPYNRPGNLDPSDDLSPIFMPLPIDPECSGVRRMPDGQIIVAAFTDLKRHRISDYEDRFFANEHVEQANVPTDEFLTAKLWDVGTSPPYGHRGDCSTISEAIIHHSKKAAGSRRSFLKLPDDDKRAVVAFLLSMGVMKAETQVIDRLR